MSPRLAAIVAALLLAATPAIAASHRPAPPTAVRWLAPVGGVELTAGEPLSVAWEPGADFAGLGEVEEWELFLSYDDGRSWPVRLTPHLDLERRHFEIDLPDLPSASARFLLRLGDEEVEHEIEVPGAWRIVRGQSGAWSREVAARALLEPRATRGESAREGAPGVALWLDGSRAGDRLRWRVYEPSSPGVERSSWQVVSFPQPFGAPSRAPSPFPVESSESLPAAASRRASASARMLQASSPVPVLLQTCRRNE